MERGGYWCEPDDDYRNFIQEINKIMKKRKLSIPDLARKSGIGESTTYGVLKREKMFTLDKALKICQVLDIDPDKIFKLGI